MKKILLFSLLSFFCISPAQAASIQDVGPYSAQSAQQGSEDTQLSLKKMESVVEAELKKLIMGTFSEWANAAQGFIDFPLTEVSASAVASISPSSGSKSSLFPEGQQMVAIRDKELISSPDMGTASEAQQALASESGTIEGKAGAKNTADTKLKRELAITEIGTHAYALALVNRAVASRSIGSSASSANKQASEKISSATDNTSAIATTTSVTLSGSETLNSLVNVNAVSNVRESLAIAEQNNASSVLLNPLNGIGSFGSLDSSSMLGGGLGGSLGSTLKNLF